MRRRKNVYASLDLGAAEIQLLVVQKGITGLKTLSKETYPRTELAAVSRKIKEYRPKEVILLLPQERVIVRDLTIPPVEKSHIKSILYFELSGLLPYAMEQVEMDFLVVQRSRKEMKVKAFVIPDYLLRESLPLKEAGIEITRIIPRGLAATAYCKEKKLSDRLVKIQRTDGHLVVFPDYAQYFAQFFNPGQVMEESEVKDLLKDQGIDPARWDFLEFNQSEIEMLGAISFYQKHRKFTLFSAVAGQNSFNWLSLGIILVIIFIFGTVSLTVYLRLTMKQAELAVYEERMNMLKPRVEKVNNLKTEVTQVKDRFEKLAKMEETNWNYLIWLKELHILLQEDTEVSILVFEGNMLKELHGKAPLATRVSERLAKSPYFANPEFTSPITPKNEDGVIKEEFSITAQLVDPQRKGESSHD